MDPALRMDPALPSLFTSAPAASRDALLASLLPSVSSPLSFLQQLDAAAAQLASPHCTDRLLSSLLFCLCADDIELATATAAALLSICSRSHPTDPSSPASRLLHLVQPLSERCYEEGRACSHLSRVKAGSVSAADMVAALLGGRASLPSVASTPDVSVLLVRLLSLSLQLAKQNGLVAALRAEPPTPLATLVAAAEDDKDVLLQLSCLDLINEAAASLLPPADPELLRDLAELLLDPQLLSLAAALVPSDSFSSSAAFALLQHQFVYSRLLRVPSAAPELFEAALASQAEAVADSDDAALAAFASAAQSYLEQREGSVFERLAQLPEGAVNKYLNLGKKSNAVKALILRSVLALLLGRSGQERAGAAAALLDALGRANETQEVGALLLKTAKGPDPDTRVAAMDLVAAVVGTGSGLGRMVEVDEFMAWLMEGSVPEVTKLAKEAKHAVVKAVIESASGRFHAEIEGALRRVAGAGPFGVGNASGRAVDVMVEEY
ncbi:hypothetical protein TeGR_g9916 [Tetraparma gracilis]|uniref:Uncharacterized protein n=1 Tax=Tetraparma gracilis TaxID=2962635 RepID=A0ABQ6M5P2_9STRA|nr:hypothetical protein TeGR_g9916 [Tetraparma gracilis]